MQLKFDSTHNAIPPAFVLATRSGRKLGAVPAQNIQFNDRLNAYSEFSFKVYKYNNNVRCDIWDKVDNFKLVFCPEWNMWFEIRVEISEKDNTVKNVEGRTLGEAELSQILIYNTEINTENDILREDYKPTVLWNPADPQASLLNRIMEKAPHYRIKHVDESIKRIQRTFTFDNKSIYDAFQEIAEEIVCLFVIETKASEDKLIDRTVSVYDLETVCNNCGYRGEFIDTCSKCGSKNVKSGYGSDTTIFISTDNLADNITYSVDVDNVKNCFKLAAGDDLMTAAIRNCNPNGSDYIWFFNPQAKENMSAELVQRLDEYDALDSYYQTNYKFKVDPSVRKKYNDLVNKYIIGNDKLKPVGSEISGFVSLMDAYCGTIDFNLYLSDEMMPNADLPETNAAEEAKKLNAMNLSAIAVTNKSNASEATVTSAALSYARVLVDSRYQVKVYESRYSSERWTGSFKVTRYSDDEDTAVSNSVTVTLSDDYGTFVKQKIDKVLAKARNDSAEIVGLFELSDTKFKEELKKYCLASLLLFYECCQGCLDVLIDQGAADISLWEDRTPNLYQAMYLPYRNRLDYIQAEITLRESEIAIVTGQYDKDGKIEKPGMQSILSEERNKIQAALDFKKYLGDELWKEFSSYRRESLYKNDNYISDGLSDTELFENALEFLEKAKKEIYKSAVLQHSISSTLKNLLAMKEFAPLIKYFDVGNWLRIRVDDKVYKLRLLEYDVDFDNLDTLSVNFSDVIETADGISDFDSILKQAMSISSSYGEVSHQAETGNQSYKQMNDWVEKGLNVTNQRIISSAENQDQVWDEHGMLFRKYDEISDSYEDEQIKIINSTLAMTNDNWQTVRTAVGKYYFFDPADNYKLKVTYGVIAETIVGKMILGERLGIYTDNGSMSFDKNGLNITNGINNFNVNPNSDELMTISNGERDLLRFDKNGQLYISGDGSALDINANDAITGLHSRITQTADEIRLEVENIEEGLSAQIKINADNISSEVSRAKSSEEKLSTRINETAEEIKLEAQRAMGAEGELRSSITVNAEKIKLLVTETSSGNGTSFEVNSDAIKVAWNQSNKYVKLEDGGLNIYNTSNKLLLSMNEYGMNVYNNGNFVGQLGLTLGVGDGNGDGICLGLEPGHNIVGFGASNGSSFNYNAVFCYYRPYDRLYAFKDLDMQNNTILKANLNNPSFTNAENCITDSMIQSVSIRKIDASSLTQGNKSITVLTDCSLDEDGNLYTKYSTLGFYNGVLTYMEGK